MSAADVLGTIGVLLNQVFIWPQVARALRTVEGVAALSVLGGLLARSTWTLYGARLGDLALVLGNATVTVGFAALLVLLLRASGRRLALLGGAAAGAALVLAAHLSGPAVLGWVAVVSAAVVNLPQMLRALADPQRLAGVSVPTYLLVSLASACWLSYGVAVREPLISAPHLLLLPTGLATAWLAARSQRRARVGPAAPAR